MKTWLSISLGLLLGATAGCYAPSIPNGKLQCSIGANKCPEGYHCASDGTCWANGKDPGGTTPDMTTGGSPDLTMPGTGDMARPLEVVPPHTGTAVLSGGVTAKSENFKIIMSTGQAPGGNATTKSATNKKQGGVVGATQNSQ